MDFAAALKKLEKETNPSSSSSSQQQQQQQRDGSRQEGGAIRGSGGGGRGSNYYGGGGGGDRRRGRNEYDPHRDNNDRRRNQRPRYNSHHQRGGGGGGGSGGGGGRGDYDRGGSGSGSYYARDHSNDSRSGGGQSRSGSGGGCSGGGNNSNSNSSWPLEEMHRFGYHVSPIPYHRRYNSNSSDNMKPPTNLGQRPFHIALLCICIDSLPFEHLWREWAQTGNAHVSLLIHAKYPDKIVAQAKREEEEEERGNGKSSSSSHRPACMVRDRLLTKPPRVGRGKSYADPEYLTHMPAWGSVQITRAMLELLTAAAVIGTPQDTERSDVRFMSQRYLLPKMMCNDADKKGVALVVGVVDPNDIPPVDKFIFISETCIPVQTLQECEDALFGDKALYTSLSCKEEKPAVASEQQQPSSSNNITPWEVSWVNARHPQTSPGTTPRNKYERDQFHDIHAMIPIEYRWKADQWHCLSRPHALAVLQLDAHLRPHLQLWNSFTRINASDEMYFPTALSILGILNTKDVIMSTSSSTSSTTTGNNNTNNTANDANDQKQPPKEDSDKAAITASTGNNTAAPSSANSTTTTTTRTGSIALRPITYTDWSEGMRNPATFSKGMRDFCKIAKLARQQGSLLARKFALVCPSVAAINDNNKNNSKMVVVEQTGHITASEWRNEVERMASDAADAAAATQEI